MLERLLELLQSGETRNVNELARALDTSPEMVRAMLENLKRLGYLKEIDDLCGSECSGCAIAGSCGARANAKIWMVTHRVK